MLTLEEAESILSTTSYQLIKVLGSGYHSTVFEAYDKINERSVALKIVSHVTDIDDNVYLGSDKEAVMNFVCPEISTLKVLNQTKFARYVPELYRYFLIKHEGIFYPVIVEEIVKGQTFYQIAQKWAKTGIQTEMLEKIIRQTLHLICSLASIGIYHNDINVTNIFYDGKNIRLIDFGRAYYKKLKCSDRFVYTGDKEKEAWNISQAFMLLIGRGDLIDESFNRMIVKEDIKIDGISENTVKVLVEAINQEADIFQLFFFANR